MGAFPYPTPMQRHCPHFDDVILQIPTLAWLVLELEFLALESLFLILRIFDHRY